MKLLDFYLFIYIVLDVCLYIRAFFLVPVLLLRLSFRLLKIIVQNRVLNYDIRCSNHLSHMLVNRLGWHDDSIYCLI